MTVSVDIHPDPHILATKESNVYQLDIHMKIKQKTKVWYV